MSIYTRENSSNLTVVDRWENGVGWLPHPDEPGRRVSHAIRGNSGLWLLDPLDGPGLDDVLSEYNDVVGVAVLSNYHTRDADALAQRYNVPVHLPRWIDRVPDQLTAPIEWYDTDLGDSGFRVRKCSPLPGWHEGIAYRRSDRTLYIPDVLGTAPLFTVGDERLGVYLLRRLLPPLEPFVGIDPQRILCGHGTGIFTDAPLTLRTALTGTRQTFPRAAAENGRAQLRAIIDALR